MPATGDKVIKKKKILCCLKIYGQWKKMLANCIGVNIQNMWRTSITQKQTKNEQLDFKMCRGLETSNLFH